MKTCKANGIPLIGNRVTRLIPDLHGKTQILNIENSIDETIPKLIFTFHRSPDFVRDRVQRLDSKPLFEVLKNSASESASELVSDESWPHCYLCPAIAGSQCNKFDMKVESLG